MAFQSLLGKTESLDCATEYRLAVWEIYYMNADKRRGSVQKKQLFPPQKTPQSQPDDHIHHRCSRNITTQAFESKASTELLRCLTVLFRGTWLPQPC